MYVIIIQFIEIEQIQSEYYIYINIYVWWFIFIKIYQLNLYLYSICFCLFHLVKNSNDIRWEVKSRLIYLYSP